MNPAPKRSCLVGAVLLEPSSDGGRGVEGLLRSALDPQMWRMLQISRRGAVAFTSSAGSCAPSGRECGFAATGNYSGVTCQSIARAYRRRGVDFPSLLNERFSVVVYDEARDRVVLGADTFAESGIWYFIRNGVLYFADNCEWLFETFSPPRDPCPQSIDSWFVMGQMLPPNTGYLGISRLPLNSVLILEGGRVEVRGGIWRPTPAVSPESGGDAAEQVRHVLERECARIAQRGSRIGMLFSGGVDSTVLAALLCRHSADLTAYILSTDGGKSDSGAQATAGRLGIPLTHTTLSDPSELHPRFVVARTGMAPFTFAESYISCFLQRIAPEVDHLITGCGADTAFIATGPMLQAVSSMKAIPPSRTALQRKALVLPRSLTPHKRGVRALLYTPEFRRRLQTSNPLALLADTFLEFAGCGDRTAIMMQFLAMNHSRNVAVYSHNLHAPKTVHWPYLAKAFLNAAVTVSAWRGDTGDPEKRLLRSLLPGFLPATSEDARKRGFGDVLQLSRWFTQDRVRAALGDVLDSGICDAGILEPAGVRVLYEACESDQRPVALLNLAWSTLSLAEWFSASFK